MENGDGEQDKTRNMLLLNQAYPPNPQLGVIITTTPLDVVIITPRSPTNNRHLRNPMDLRPVNDPNCRGMMPWNDILRKVVRMSFAVGFVLIQYNLQTPEIPTHCSSGFGSRPMSSRRPSSDAGNSRPRSAFAFPSRPIPLRVRKPAASRSVGQTPIPGPKPEDDDFIEKGDGIRIGVSVEVQTRKVGRLYNRPTSPRVRTPAPPTPIPRPTSRSDQTLGEQYLFQKRRNSFNQPIADYKSKAALRRAQRGLLQAADGKRSGW